MVNWLITNKEWLLSGIAVAVPVAIITWFLMRRSTNSKQIQKSGKNSINIQVGRDINIVDTELENKNDRKR
jgi:cell division protein YceG involved in septum cleavage